MSGLTTATSSALATIGCHQYNFGGATDAYLARFDSTGLRLWGTYYGGVLQETGKMCMSDPNGNVFLAGSAQSNDSTVIATSNAYQPIKGGGIWDAYLVKFDSMGIRQWGTYYGGGNDDDIGNGCAIDGNGNVFLTGYTNSTNGIYTSGAHQTSCNAGPWDAFLVKFKDCEFFGPSINFNAPICSGVNINLQGSVTSSLVMNYFWSGPNSFTSSIPNPSISNASTIHTGIYSLTVDDGGICIQSTSISLTVYPNPTVSAFSNNTLICVGQSATLTAIGANSYVWNPGGSGNNINVSPIVTTNYTVTGTDLNGCINSAVISQSVDACTGIVLNEHKNEIALFPNPTENLLYVNANNNFSLLLFNSIGQLVLKKEIVEGSNEIDISFLVKGIYFAQAGSEVKRIIKE
jgi:hypothetical protein